MNSIRDGRNASSSIECGEMPSRWNRDAYSPLEISAGNDSRRPRASRRQTTTTG